ncbi:MAG: Cu(I)-responsive transcriptional regulator [Hyphomicrobiales bacterium]|nr:MAG: Cu(I)-responsive transcriptional regulator [Hyphomicrobiales bacterium]
MNIGDAAQACGLPAKTIRYYEEIKLVSPARRNNGYRDYSDADIHRLRFLQRARGLGFSIDDCRQLLSLYDDKNRASADVKALARTRIAEIDAKVAELQSLRATLNELAEACHGDDRPDCPILEGLAGSEKGCCDD